ncbi:MAG: aminotransferase class I/II-fold pyridoxal phosphate-dependent enzyme [Erysipelotrichales bacterium]|nr:aminotransferase class I/II-fold pyridoxal phosphate-dependent enzyme [Erysipelotrichales bacterium]
MNIDKLVIKDYDRIFYNRFQDVLDQKNKYDGPFKLIDFGVGEEKSMPDERILKSFNESLNKSNNHKYSDNEAKELLKSAKSYLKRNFEVEVKDNELMHVIGAKSILAIIPSLFVSDGDYVVTLNPSYVILERAAKLCGANIAYLSLKEENQFYPNLDEISEDIWKKTKILNLNFPHNPTGATVDENFYKKAIALAKKYNFIIINDAAYLGISYHKPLSFLSVDGAKEVGIEIFSLSKSHNMTGFRIGFVAGNSRIIELLKLLKNNFDSGQYIPIQLAAKTALDCDDITESLKDKYLTRMKKIAMILFEHGLYAYIPYGTFYLYFKVPSKVKDVTFKTAQEFSSFLLERVGIMTIPYDEEGHYIRLSMTFECDDENAFYEDLRSRLNLVFF